MEFDQGTEFYNKKFLDLLKRLKIEHFSVYSDRKGAVVERFNRTLKTRMYRSFTAQGGHRWVDNLQHFIDGYNDTKHSSTGYKPNDVNTSNEDIVRKNLYPALKRKKVHTTPHFKIGDTVRISRKKDTFQKGYEQTYSHQVYEISKVQKTYPVTYKIKDFNNEEIEGSFYKNELQLVDKSDHIYPINRTIKTRKRNGKTEYLVNFKDYPENLTEWVPQSALYPIKNAN